MTGQTLGHYRLESKIGEGGMGVVYKAHDTHLERAVAVKILPAEAVANPERKRRFIQEARAASALNHPNIITIYDIDISDGVDFIAMEYVAGRTLDQAIGRSGLAVSDALKYAVQIADALAKAHAAGIVHRDLKPSNVMVTADGAVKVLDFGLAKLTEQASDEDATVTLDQAPRTEEGTIVGTVAYMSPEQAQGKKVDARSDIFSFGAVLYEMLAGRRAFQRESRISTLAAILHQEPQPIEAPPEEVPRELQRILAHCLRKDPARRLQHMDDVRTLLEGVREESESGRAAVPARPRSRWRPWLAGAGVLVVAASSAITWWVARSPSRTAGPATSVLTRLTSNAGLTTDPALSPDGKLVAYASDRAAAGDLDIWVQQVAGGEPIRLTQDPADDRNPVFSPDGTQIAFRSEREGGGIYLVSALGGEARRITRLGRNPRFSPSGDRLAYWTGEGTSVPGKVYVISLAGGPPQPIEPGFFQARYPIWSPDGKRLLFMGARDAKLVYDWWVAPLGGEAVETGVFAALRNRRLGNPSPEAIWTAGNRILFSAASGDTRNLWQVSLSARNWRMTGPPERITSGPGWDELPTLVAGPDGVPHLAFAILNQNIAVWALPIDANRGKVTGAIQRLTQGISSDTRPHVSPDGRLVAFQSNRSGNSDIWLKDLPTGKEIALTRTPISEVSPKFTGDAARLAYESGDRAIDVVSLGRGGQPGETERLCSECRLPTDWSPDGKVILFEMLAASSIALADAATGNKAVILKHPSQGLSNGRFSPDGRWISFHSIAGPSTRRIYVAPFRGAVEHPQSEWIPITDGAGMDRYAAWSPDGNLLYFLSEREGFRCIWAQRLEPATKRPAGAPFEVYAFHHTRQSLWFPGDPVNVGFSVARDKLVFSLWETTGNIWMTRLER